MGAVPKAALTAMRAVANLGEAVSWLYPRVVLPCNPRVAISSQLLRPRRATVVVVYDLMTREPRHQKETFFVLAQDQTSYIDRLQKY